MEIIVSARHMDVTESMRDEVESRLHKIAEKYSKLTKAEVVMSSNKGRHEAEIVLHGKQINLDAKAETENMYESIHQAADKMERQLEKKTRNNKHGHKHLGNIEAELEEAALNKAVSDHALEDDLMEV